jgi:hypothetical protein
MTTDQANKAIKNFQALKAQNDSFVAEVEPFKNSFHAFLSQNLHLSKWIDFNITLDADTVIVTDFELSLNNTVEGGVLFYTEVNDCDGATSLSFVVPFVYMANPEGWMNEVLKSAASDQKLMEDIYDEVAPGVREELQLDIHINSVYPNGEIYAVVCEKGNDGLTFGHPDTHKMIMNSFAVDSNTGEIIYRHLI